MQKCHLSNTTHGTINYLSFNLGTHLFHLLYVPISALLPDLHHVDLIPGNFVDATIRTHPTPPNQIENIPTGMVLPPVPTSLVEKSESGAFIEIGDLIPTHLGLDDTARSKLRHSVTNISEWLQAFTVYVSVIAKKQPNHVPDLMGYQILILEASNESCNDCWLGYDRRFRQLAASRSNCKWSDMDSTLWNMAFTAQARTGQCVYCFSLFHASKHCELTSDGGVNTEPQYLRSRRTVPRSHRLICCHWNEGHTPNCSFPNCRYEHICSLCTFNPEATDVHHRAVYCPCRLSQGRGRPSATGQSQPTPLLS